VTNIVGLEPRSGRCFPIASSSDRILEGKYDGSGSLVFLLPVCGNYSGLNQF